MAETTIDTFASDHLPAADLMPEFLLELPALHAKTMNAAAFLLDAHVDEGRGGRRCIVAPGVIDWTYEDLQHASNRIANILVEDFHIKRGNRVLLRAPNTPMLAACWFAVMKVGAIAVTTMPLYRSGELRHMIEKADVALSLCDVRLADELIAAAGPAPIVYFNTEAADGIEARMDKHSPHFSTVETHPEDVAMIAFTSGTTGTPKAAMHYHRDILATCETFGARVLKPKRDDLFCGSPPLAFTFGLGGLLLFPLYVGAATLLLEKAPPEELMKAIGKFGVTTIFTAPIAYRAMTALADKYDISSLHTCVSAGETLPKPVWDGWHAATRLKIIDGIGSTEMLHIFIGSPIEDVRAGSTGKAVPGYIAEIHDKNGIALAPGHIGRLAIKGPTGCKYLDDERQSTYVQNGWNYPGDAYRMDKDGYFWYVARADDMIISAGYNISGPEVEQALLAHNNVKECAVVSKPDPAHGTNIVKAFVVLTESADANNATSLELMEFCKMQIAAFKAPREIEFVAQLPRTETGKVQRYKLRERASTE